MKISRDEVARVAVLARLELSEQEMEEYGAQLNNILDYAEKLNEVDTDGVVPTAHVLPLKNVFREDKAVTFLAREEVLQAAPEVEDGMFKVPQIIE